jgi:WD40 repeat protein
LNKLAFDPSGKVLSVAGNDGTLHFISTKDHTVSRAIQVSETALNAIAFEKGGESLVVAGSGEFFLPSGKTQYSCDRSTDGLIRSFQ